MVLNYIWIGFFVIGFLVALIRLGAEGNIEIFTKMVEDMMHMAEFSVMNIALPLAGVMIFWMGMMKIAENSGLVNVFSRIMWPFFKYIFPDIPKGHPAAGAMMMNFSANFLGLDNAATPLGIKAIKELQILNNNSDRASNSQIMFLVLNTSGLTLIPTSIIALRASAHSQSPTDIFLPVLIATTISTLAALLAVSLYQRINLFQFGFIWRLFAFLSVLAVLVTLILKYSICSVAENSSFIASHPGLNPDSSCASDKLGRYSSFAGSFIIIGTLISFISFAAYQKVNVFDSFIEGAKDGFGIVLQIIPYLLAMLVGIAFFKSSGAMDFLIDGIRSFIGIFTQRTEFAEALPTALMRPLSGGGARALMIESWGEGAKNIDSFVGHTTSVIQGSTETTFYTVAVYYGAIGIKHVRHTVTCGLIADFVGATAAIILSYLFFMS